MSVASVETTVALTKTPTRSPCAPAQDDTAWSVVPSPDSATPTSPAPATPVASTWPAALSPSVETSWSDGTQTPVSPSVATHTTPQSKWVEGDCELVTRDGAVLTVPSYHLQSASPVFRKKIATDAGWAQARVPVDADAATVEHFLDIVTTGEVRLQWTSQAGAIAAVARLAEFLGVYRCEAAENILAKHLKEQAGVVLPPITLMLAGIRLQREDLIQFMLIRHSGPEHRLWVLPNPARAHVEQVMPFVPFEVYALIPIEHQWALRMAGSDEKLPQCQGSYRRYCHYLAQAKEAAKAELRWPQSGPVGDDSDRPKPAW